MTCVARICLQDGEGPVEEQLLPNDDPYLQAKDQNECTPLHIAILQGECTHTQYWQARILINPAARQTDSNSKAATTVSSSHSHSDIMLWFSYANWLCAAVLLQAMWSVRSCWCRRRPACL